MTATNQQIREYVISTTGDHTVIIRVVCLQDPWSNQGTTLGSQLVHSNSWSYTVTILVFGNRYNSASFKEMQPSKHISLWTWDVCKREIPTS